MLLLGCSKLVQRHIIGAAHRDYVECWVMHNPVLLSDEALMGQNFVCSETDHVERLAGSLAAQTDEGCCGDPDSFQGGCCAPQGVSPTCAMLKS